MIRSVLISAVALLSFAAGSFAQAPSKVGVISFQGAIIGTKDGQKAAQQLEQKFAPKEKEFKTRQDEVAQLEDQLNKGGNLMSEDKRSQMVRDIDEKKRRLQRDAQDAREELNGEQQKLLGDMAQRMQAVVEKYAKDNGFTLVLDVSNQQTTPVVFASSSIDITQDIIALYDKSTPSGTTPTSAPAPGTTAPGSPATPGSPAKK